MPRIRITKSNEVHSVRASNGKQQADIPIDGKFHEIHDDLLPVLNDSAVEFEVEAGNAEAPSGSADAGGAAGLGGSAAPSPLDRIESLAAKVSAAAA